MQSEAKCWIVFLKRAFAIFSLFLINIFVIGKSNFDRTDILMMHGKMACNPSSYCRSSNQGNEPVSTFYLTNISINSCISCMTLSLFFFYLFIYWETNTHTYKAEKISSNIKTHHKIHSKVMIIFKGWWSKLYGIQHPPS